LLMDEPFGAVDPITRQRLQDELLNIQSEVQKTIVCVTHDFDEAVKLGDWIAIFNEGAQLEQYDSPERILANPASEFVENFIGSGAGLKQLTLTRVNEVDLEEAITTSPGKRASDVLSQVQGAGRKYAVVLDSRGRPLRRLDRRQLSRAEIIDGTYDQSLPVVGEQATLNDALDTMLVASSESALVTGRRDVLLGTITVQTVMEAIAAANGAQDGDHSAPVGLNSGAINIVDINSGAANSDGEPV